MKHKPITKKYNITIFYLKKYISHFKTIASAFAKHDVNILSSKDAIGSYYEKNIILPTKINIAKNKQINKNCYIYKILFSLASKSFNFYITRKKENYDYKIINSILTVKKINRELFKNYSKIKKIVKKLYPIVNKTRKNITNLTGRALLIEIIIKKLTYEKTYNIAPLTEKENIWLFNLENTINITDKTLSKHADELYNNICNIHNKYQTIELYLLWGYLYEKNNKKLKNLIKNKIIDQYTNKKTKELKKQITKQKTIKLKNTTTKNLTSIFDYKKTYDNYMTGNKNIEQSNHLSENTNAESVIKTNDKSNIFIKSNIINTLDITNSKHNNTLDKKVIYKEWDYKKNIYKKNWCHLFIKKLATNKMTVVKYDKNLRKEINIFKRYFNIIINKKLWQNKKIHGQDIDIDSIIDNYTYIKKCNFEKVYKHKIKTLKNISLIILIDSSLSTESYVNGEQILHKIKTLATIIAGGMQNVTNNFLISSFYSNTRHDCRYLILKNFKEKWKESISILEKIKPTGYTRIGPAIRHSISILKKVKTEKKIILLLSDGNPTDYDEYEGLYGLNDVKKTINEANKNKILLKSILINNCKNKNFKNVFGLSNYYTITNRKTMHIQLIKLLKSITRC